MGILRQPKNEFMELPDTTDLNIISALRANPRVTNKKIAVDLGIAESTVAQRIRGMAERGIMKVVAQKHVFSDGYQVMCFLFINTSDRTVQKISADIAKHRDVTTVSQGVGNPDIVVVLHATSMQSAYELAGEIGSISGVDTLDFSACIKVHKFVSDLGDISASFTKLDEQEDSIFVRLSQDGRQSNREIARQLDISEGTVRQRLNKMLQAGEMQFEVVCNPAALRIDTPAIARVTTLTRHSKEVLEALHQSDAISFLAEVTGKANILAHIHASSPQELGNICDNQLLSIRGVQSVQVQILVSNAKHLFHYAYFNGSEKIQKRK